jgi:phosphate transport system substrate-binding protein
MLRRFCLHILLILAVVSVTMSACQSGQKLNEGKDPNDTYDDKGFEETTTRGSIRMGVDESMMPVVKQWVEAFLNTYPDAHLEVWYKAEGLLMQDLLADSIRLAIVGRDWTPAEKQAIRKSKIQPHTNPLGTDAVALLVHPENPIDSISFEQLQQILEGKIKDWSQLGAGSSGQIILAFDGEQSGIVRYLQDQVMGTQKQLPANAFAAGDHPKVTDYVAGSKQSLGFVGNAWYSDKDSRRVQDDLARVKFMRIISPDTADLPGVAVAPYPNEIALSRYPLRRGIYALSREHFTGLGTGFVSFAASERGQRILLKAGLLPEFYPPRVIILPEKEDN